MLYTLEYQILGGGNNPGDENFWTTNRRGGWNKSGGGKRDEIENRKHRLLKKVLQINTSIHMKFALNCSLFL